MTQGRCDLHNFRPNSGLPLGLSAWVLVEMLERKIWFGHLRTSKGIATESPESINWYCLLLIRKEEGGIGWWGRGKRIEMPTASRGLNLDLRASRGPRETWCPQKYLEGVAILCLHGLRQQREGVSLSLLGELMHVFYYKLLLPVGI